MQKQVVPRIIRAHWSVIQLFLTKQSCGVQATLFSLSLIISIELTGMETHSFLRFVEPRSLNSLVSTVADVFIPHLQLFCSIDFVHVSGGVCVHVCFLYIICNFDPKVCAMKFVLMFGCMKPHSIAFNLSISSCVCNCCLTRCGAEPLSKNQCKDLAGVNGCEITLGEKHALLSPAGLLPALRQQANLCSPLETCL